MPYHSSYIAGVKFRHDAARVIGTLDEGQLLDLNPEPEKYDSNAVRVLCGNVHLGYIPAKLSEQVAGLIGAGRFVRCELREGKRIRVYYEEAGQ